MKQFVVFDIAVCCLLFLPSIVSCSSNGSEYGDGAETAQEIEDKSHGRSVVWTIVSFSTSIIQFCIFSLACSTSGLVMILAIPFAIVSVPCGLIGLGSNLRTLSFISLCMNIPCAFFFLYAFSEWLILLLMALCKSVIFLIQMLFDIVLVVFKEIAKFVLMVFKGVAKFLRFVGSLPLALFDNALNRVVQDWLVHDVGRFFDEYSFEDPTSAHEIWMKLPSATKSFIARVHPEAADVMEQTDQQLLLIKQELARENLRRNLENQLRQIQHDDYF